MGLCRGARQGWVKGREGGSRFRSDTMNHLCLFRSCGHHGCCHLPGPQKSAEQEAGLSADCLSPTHSWLRAGGQIASG